MATIRENILEDLLTTLKGVTTGNGYNNTLKSVRRYRQHDNSHTPVPYLGIKGGPEKKVPEPNPLQTVMMTVFLDLWFAQDPDDMKSTDTILNSLYGDIEKAVMVDITRNGNAIDTLISEVAPFETVEGEPYAGMAIDLGITYQHSITNPENLT